MIHKQNKERKTNNENNSDFSLMSDVAAEAGAATLSGVPGPFCASMDCTQCGHQCQSVTLAGSPNKHQCQLLSGSPNKDIIR